MPAPGSAPATSERTSADGGAPDLARLAVNQMTTQRWSLREAVAGYAAAGVGGIGLWREKVAEVGLEEAGRIVRDAGLTVTSLCRGGFFPGHTERERREKVDDNRRAVDEAAALGTDVVVLVCGGLPGTLASVPVAQGQAGQREREVVRDVRAVRGMVAEGIAAVEPHARACGVKLAIEPMHPAFAADRSVVVTLAQALDLAETIGSDHVGVVVDTYHVWWDPDLEAQLDRAAGRILSYQVSDWLSPMPDEPLYGRGVMGDGVIELRRLRHAVEAAGYTGPVEVEIFNRSIWEVPGERLLERLRERYLSVC